MDLVRHKMKVSGRLACRARNNPRNRDGHFDALTKNAGWQVTDKTSGHCFNMIIELTVGLTKIVAYKSLTTQIVGDRFPYQRIQDSGSVGKALDACPAKVRLNGYHICDRCKPIPPKHSAHPISAQSFSPKR